MALTQPMIDALRKVHTETTAGGHYFANIRHPMLRALLTQNHVEQIKDAEGNAIADPADANKVAVRLTDSGRAELPPGVVTAPVTAASPDVPLPGAVQTGETTDLTNTAAPKKRGPRGPRVVPEVFRGDRMAMLPGIKKVRQIGSGKRAETYPFSSLEAPSGTQDAEGRWSENDNFFVPNSETIPSAYKLLRPSVNATNKKRKEAGDAARFAAFDVDPNVDPAGVPGCRVYRVA